LIQQRKRVTKEHLAMTPYRNTSKNTSKKVNLSSHQAEDLITQRGRTGYGEGVGEPAAEAGAAGASVRTGAGAAPAR
jgi:hypothetical protein